MVAIDSRSSDAAAAREEWKNEVLKSKVYNPRTRMNPSNAPEDADKSVGNGNAGAGSQALDLKSSIAVNMLEMVGVGPFITLPLIVSAMGGPQAMLGWILGAGRRHVRRAGMG